MSLFPPTKTPAPLPGSAVLPKEKGRFIFVCFTPVSVHFCCAIVVFLVFQLFQQLAAQEADAVPVGGNRIGGNAVCDFVVFGRIAGSNASAYAAA